MHHWVHRKHDEDKQNKDNLEKLTPLGTQDTRRRQTEQRQSRETDTIGYTRHMTKKNKTKSIIHKQRQTNLIPLVVGSILATVMIIPSSIPPFYRNS